MVSELRRFAYRLAVRSAVFSVLPQLTISLQTGEILDTTEFAAALFGYTEAELVGRPVEIVVPDALKSLHAIWREDPPRTPRNRLMGAGRQVWGQKKDGSLFPCHVGLTLTTVEWNDVVEEVATAFVVDLTGMTMSSASPPGENKA